MSLADRFQALLDNVESKVNSNAAHTLQEKTPCKKDSGGTPNIRKNGETDSGPTDDEMDHRPKSSQVECETDPVRLKKRQRQIDIGKNTVGYEKFLRKYPNRFKRPKDGPWTPQKYRKCSTRSWAGQIVKWRRQLHEYDEDDDLYIVLEN